MPREIGENRGGAKRDINAGKARSLTVIMRWEIVVQTAQRGGRKEKSEKVGIRRLHRVTP